MSDLLSATPLTIAARGPGVTNSNTLNFREQLLSDSRITLRGMMNDSRVDGSKKGKQRSCLGAEHLIIINTRISSQTLIFNSDKANPRFVLFPAQ